MIQVSFEIANAVTRFRDTVRAGNIARAAEVARGRYPQHDIRLALPIDPDTFFAGDNERLPAKLNLIEGRRR